MKLRKNCVKNFLTYDNAPKYGTLFKKVAFQMVSEVCITEQRKKE